MSHLIVIGIDPGMTGAVALVDATVNPVRAEFFDTPTLDAPTTKRHGARIYDEVAMAVILRTIRGRMTNVLPMVYIEQVHSMPKQGVASSFTFGMGYGIWLGIIAALGLPSVRVTPQRWKKVVLADGPKTDQAEVAFAGRLYPHVADQLRTPRGRLELGRADALLVAHFGLLQAG